MRPVSSALLLVEDIYKAVGDGSRWPAVLRSFKQICDSPVCALGRFDFERRVGDLDQAVGLDDQYRISYRQRFVAKNSWLAREECFRREGAVWTGRELAEHSELIGSDFYRGWLKPQDLFHASFAVLRWSGAETVYFMALRSPDAGAFERRALEGLELYLPHLHQAVALAERLGSLASDKVRRLQELVGEAQGAIMVLDGDQKVIAASPAAETLLVRGRLGRSGRRGLHLAHDRDRESLGRRLTRALQVANGTVVDGFQPPGPDLDEHTSVIPLPAGSLPGQDRPAVAVMSDDRLPNEERLRQTYGLTPAEARLALRLARGLSVQEAAKRLEIAITTARTHLQRVYGKTHTCRQSELVALLLGGQKRPE